MNPFYRRIYRVVRHIPKGRVATYGVVARLAGRPPLMRHFSVARLVGRPLSPAEQSFVETLTSCCAKQADYAEACVGAPKRRA